ncbi:hypothetical protein RclHR1_04070002 [Rhizophagus clarus]|uniref:Uncharacterized protein n=1 Tax=Rhizophagus clarus TaxID=94130 RepID=A0A2Z6RVU3_9GLOM|nr:hypothetical protein RclHR1_04070002 [Rhizophagus clarus]GET02012.1 hypothetical protein RCL_jg15624.t1 [Rhizophagus clarus]
MKLDKILERQKVLETQLSRMDSEIDTRMKKYLKTIKDQILKMKENNTKDSFNTDFIEKIVKSVSKKLMKVSIYPTTEEMRIVTSRYMLEEHGKSEKLRHPNKRTSYKAKEKVMGREDYLYEETNSLSQEDVTEISRWQDGKEDGKKDKYEDECEGGHEDGKEDGKDEGKNGGGYEDQNDKSEGDY